MIHSDVHGSLIPRVIHQTWHTRKLPRALQKQVDASVRRNPDYRHRIYTDREIDAFVEDNFPGELVDCYARLQIAVAKADFWRYLILYRCGGVYLDLDSSIQQPLVELIEKDDSAIVTAERNPELFVQWALIFSPGLPILERTIRLIVENIQANRFPNDIHQMTGPSVFSRAVREIHQENFSDSLRHADIDESTDRTFDNGAVRYRLYGIDYGPYFRFKHDKAHLLDKSRKHWRIEQTEKNLLR